MLEHSIRPARASDASTLTLIACESKRHWGYPEHWMALWREALTLTPAYISEHVVYVAEVEGKTVAFGALVGAGKAWELDHLWVRPAFIGRGLGSRLFRHGVSYLAVHTTGAVLGIESEPGAAGFYVRMGARRVREITREWEGLCRTLPYFELAVESPPATL